MARVASPRRIFQCWMISPAASASSMSRMAGRGSYSTTIASRPRFRATGSSAATRATASPTCRTTSAASTGQSDWIMGMMFWPGRSRAVRIARTPGIMLAWVTSRSTMRAWGWGERSTPAIREPAKARSSM